MAESSVSGDLWSDLYYLYFAIAAIVGALVVGWLFYNLWAFRYRPDRPRPADAPIAGAVPVERGHPLWSYVMAGLIALIMFGLAFGTISAVQTIEIPPPCDEDTECIYHDIIGFQFGWKYNYTGVGGVPFQVITPGETQFTVPVDTPIIFNLTSQDVWHNFAIPDFRIRVDAIPGTNNPLWFQATRTGEFRNACVQICGINHANMHAMMSVVTKEEYATWLQERSEKAFNDLEARATRATVVNATFDGSAITFDLQTVAANRPVVLRATNEGAAPVTFAIGNAALVADPGETVRLYARVPADGAPIEVAAGEARATLEVGE